MTQLLPGRERLRPKAGGVRRVRGGRQDAGALLAPHERAASGSARRGHERTPCAFSWSRTRRPTRSWSSRSCSERAGPSSSSASRRPRRCARPSSGQAWDVVISDWSMPKFSAPAALGVLKRDGASTCRSSSCRERSARRPRCEAMRAGAHDYVLKDKLGRLTPAVERELRECKERAARREAERALRESEARFRRLAESGIIGIMIADVHGNILDANDTYLKMLGYSREELAGGAPAMVRTDAARVPSPRRSAPSSSCRRPGWPRPGRPRTFARTGAAFRSSSAWRCSTIRRASRSSRI